MAGNYHSFPTGHATMAFMTLQYLNQEYGDRSVWYSVGGYEAATAIGTLRLYNGAHWLSAVVAGAGIGIASMKLTYLVYPYFKKVLLGDKAA
ncbi:phosphatase PAP2 family protein [Arcticibacter sp.]|uniref:phosphatase PAP2 family protein n=1 Tax=Arcticibacter sp. TaxID=1872630 RepID=UPI003890EC51